MKDPSFPGKEKYFMEWRPSSLGKRGGILAGEGGASLKGQCYDIFYPFLVEQNLAWTPYSYEQGKRFCESFNFQEYIRKIRVLE